MVNFKNESLINLNIQELFLKIENNLYDNKGTHYSSNFDDDSCLTDLD